MLYVYLYIFAKLDVYTQINVPWKLHKQSRKVPWFITSTFLVFYFCLSRSLFVCYLSYMYVDALSDKCTLEVTQVMIEGRDLHNPIIATIFLEYTLWFTSNSTRVYSRFMLINLSWPNVGYISLHTYLVTNTDNDRRSRIP